MECKGSGRHRRLKWLRSMVKCAKKSMDIVQKHRCLCLCQLQLPMSNCQLQFPIAQLQLSNPIASDTKTICARALSIDSRSVHCNAQANTWSHFKMPSSIHTTRKDIQSLEGDPSQETTKDSQCILSRGGAR